MILFFSLFSKSPIFALKSTQKVNNSDNKIRHHAKRIETSEFRKRFVGETGFEPTCLINGTRFDIDFGVGM